jgi:twitching motility protein PilT
VPRPEEEHYPAWEARGKSSAADPQDEELLSGRRPRAAEVAVDAAFDWEKAGFEAEADPAAELPGIVRGRLVTGATAGLTRIPDWGAPGSANEKPVGTSSALPQAWRPPSPSELAEGTGTVAVALAQGEVEEDSLTSRLAALGALAPDPVAFAYQAQASGRPTFDLHIDDLLREAVERKASDLHLSEGLPPMIRVDGRLVKTEYAALNEREIQRLVYDVLNDSQIQAFEKDWELDFSYGIADVSRFRFNVYRQRGVIGAAMRAIPSRIPTIEELRLPPILRELTRRPSGLVLVTGATGAGKSTSLAAMIHVINQERDCHIVTIEDPIEYLHTHGRAMIHQRELGADTHCFRNALRAVLREDPDVILVGEMRDLETIAAALTLAETGHLVFATLHTRNAPQTIDRIVDVFPPHQQDQIKVQLANSLEAVLAQTLLPRLGGGRIAAMEIMVANSAVRALIREGKTAQLYSCIETGAQQGMQTMDRTLVELYRMGLISQEVAASASLDRDNFMRLLKTR